jgi:hypothetical protein
MKLIQTTTLGAAAASIEFTSIPQTFTDLLVLTSIRSPQNSSQAVIKLNNSTSNFSARLLRVSNTSIGSFTVTDRYILNTGFLDQTANTFSNGSIYIPNYTSSAFKTLSSDSVNENNANNREIAIFATLWSDTSAITSLLIQQESAPTNTLGIGTTISLYGITKGTDGIVTTS